MLGVKRRRIHVRGEEEDINIMSNSNEKYDTC
jgi:hypothetical protein